MVDCYSVDENIDSFNRRQTTTKKQTKCTSALYERTVAAKEKKKTIESYEISFQLKRANVAFVYLHII